MRHWKVVTSEDQQAGEGEEEMEGQDQHAGHVVQVEHAALGVLRGPEGEELAKDLAMHDDARDQRHQHHQPGKTHDLGAEVFPLKGEAVMQRIEELATDLQLIVGKYLAAARVDRAVAPYPIVQIMRAGHFVASQSCSTGSRCVVYPIHERTVSKRSGIGPSTLPRIAFTLSFVGCMVSKTGRSTLSNDGIGCGSKRDSGTVQRSNLRSNTDSEPKKNAAISTKPRTRPNHVCTQVEAWRKF